ncbi:MAG: response regulator [Fibrobacterota bacterium]
MEIKKVLIIDDEPLIVKSTGFALVYYGMATLGANNGEKGLKMAETEKPDIILLDIMMPGMDGWEVLSRLKDNPATHDIPVVVFTAKEYSNGPNLARSKGAVDYVAKPFEPEHLYQVLLRNLS